MVSWQSCAWTGCFLCWWGPCMHTEGRQSIELTTPMATTTVTLPLLPSGIDLCPTNGDREIKRIVEHRKNRTEGRKCVCIISGCASFYPSPLYLDLHHRQTYPSIRYWMTSLVENIQRLFEQKTILDTIKPSKLEMKSLRMIVESSTVVSFCYVHVDSWLREIACSVVAITQSLVSSAGLSFFG